MNAPAFYVLSPDGARLSLRVTPNARTETVDGPELRADGSCALKIRVTAPPDKGAANAAVLKLLAKTTGLPRSAFTLVSGETSRTKLIAIAGDPDVLSPILASLASR
ncbi:DUF167 domain-containing protein [Pelagibacterium mangrovi]|uniref:DUF167 domain-containing protein n=1 Tax=Pelagibacterium mangrovi TaxID=3119828 RepID=UPI002FC6EF4A